MNNCVLVDGQDELRWTFRMSEVPGTLYGARTAAGQCPFAPLVSTVRDIGFALLVNNQNNIYPWIPNRNIPLLASGCATSFTNWMTRVQSEIQLGTGSLLLGSLASAFRTSQFTIINSTTVEFDLRFDRSMCELAAPNICAIGLRLAPAPSSQEIVHRFGSSNADSYVYLRSILGPLGPELTGDDIHAVFCCDAVPEDPVDPTKLNLDCINLFPFDCEFTVPGVRRLLAIQENQVLSTTLNEIDQINSFTLNDGTGFTDLKIYGPGTTFTQEWTSEFEGSRWAQTLQVYEHPMSSPHRDLIKRLIRGRWRFIFEDENSRWWYYGRRYGVRLTSVEGKTDAYKSGTNGYNMTFQTSDYDSVWEIAPALIPDIPIDPVLDCSQYIGVPLNPFHLWVLRNCFLNDMQNNFLS